jgi:type IV secretion system protein VirB9
MNRLLHFLLATTVMSALLAPVTRAEALPAAAPSDHRIRTLLYDSHQVVRLRGWVGYHIDLEFEAGEAFKTLGGGDLEGLTIGAFENHLVLKPKAPQVKTNLTVITSRRTYIIDYAVFDGTPDPAAEDLVYSLRFTYPAETGPTTADRVTKELERAKEEPTPNIDYWYCGDPSLQPVAAADDGVHTRIRFSPRAEIPAIFLRADDGTESLLNFSMDQGDVIIHRTARRLILRRGKLTGCITNKAYWGAGERLESGTISPEVKRTTPEVRP